MASIAHIVTITTEKGHSKEAFIFLHLVCLVHLVTNATGESNVLGFPLKVDSIFPDLVCLVHI